jgi:hypothetical protein
VASEGEITSGMHPPDHGRNALTEGLALLAGLGVMLMVAAAIVGVTDSNAESVGLLFAVGVALFIAGLASWLGVVRPWENFDDISTPADSGHHHAEHEHEDDVLALPEETNTH